ncbi:hypothetical protein EDC22_110119 [Tepidamorphus gemmatus]|uniref:Alpha/beta hydrolase n=1 Tax=Tepidamorphus gemmatus TaxID=747076 RepID=A0A4R3M2P0_9HYPH|nr:hypothetical protein [Tepidamorphus gemmatus]TCT07272.1 hypothetical protein EDC22_110119 [Tepidamorphus gemmatus]
MPDARPQAAAEPSIVRRRRVLLFGGYEHVPAAMQYRRVVRELGRAAATWSMWAEAGPPRISRGGAVQSWTIRACGPNWRVETDFRYCAWDDLIATDFARPDWKALPLGIAALVDVLLTGTAFRYFRHNWRYGLFYLYPLAIVALAAAFAWLAAGIPQKMGSALPWIARLPLALAVFWLVLRWPGDRLLARYMLNDWTFAIGVARGWRPDYRDRIAVFCEEIADGLADDGVDEVVIIGHSLGAVLAVEALAGLLALRPGLVATAPPLTLMTVGSSLLKVGLHPSARDLRGAVRTVLEEKRIAWLDCTSIVDVLNFYRCDPDRALGLGVGRSPVLRTVKMRAMLGEASYARFKRNFLRLHRQFVMGNERRYHYDFFMVCCGPMPMAGRIANLTLAVDNFGADGSYLPAAGAERSDADGEAVRRD